LIGVRGVAAVFIVIYHYGKFHLNPGSDACAIPYGCARGYNYRRFKTYTDGSVIVGVSVAEVIHFVTLPFIATDDGMQASRANASVPPRL
jgi:peptidoglycan/LPS O-acetylase OafA/YrhL